MILFFQTVKLLLLVKKQTKCFIFTKTLIIALVIVNENLFLINLPG